MNNRSWKKLQIKIWDRDGRKCFVCGISEKLCLHHMDKSGDWHKQSFANNDIKNLRTLCMSCHAKLHWKEKKQSGVNNLYS